MTLIAWPAGARCSGAETGLASIFQAVFRALTACPWRTTLPTLRTMESSPPPQQKQGLGPLAWIGIGCAGIIVLAVLAFAGVMFMYGDRIRQFAADVQRNPTGTMATTMVSVSRGKLELVAQDDANKRYTVREKATGKLTTIYWDAKKKTAELVPGDFSAIPSDAAPTTKPPEPAPPGGDVRSSEPK